MLSAHEGEKNPVGCAVKRKRCGNGCEYGVHSVMSNIDVRSVDNRLWRRKKLKFGPQATNFNGHKAALTALKAGVPMCFGTAADGAQGRKLGKALKLDMGGGVQSVVLDFKEDRVWMAGLDWTDRFSPPCALKIDRILTVSR
jgi:hypothetical protein